MITLKYAKTDEAVFISHIDVLRAMVRIMRRAGYKINFSQGFNPHMLLYFSPPLALGINSLAEYVTVDVDGVNAEAFLDRFNEVAPKGFEGFKAVYSEKSPNLAGQIVKADYSFPIDEADKKKEIKEYFLSHNEYVISYKQKGEAVEKEVRRLILSVEKYDGGLIFGLATGNDNLRADRLLANLVKDFGISTRIFEIKKIAQYVSSDGKYCEVDMLLGGGV